MASTNENPAAGAETNEAAGGDAVKPDVVDDAGTDAAVDPGLVVTPAGEPSRATPDHDDKSGSTNHTGLTPDSIPVD